MTEQKTFRIIILEDNEFFNDMLTRKLEQYTTILAMERKCRFEIQSYTSPNDCLRNLRNNTDIAFIDYYLGNGVTGSDILNKIKEKCWDCKVVIISQASNLKNTFPLERGTTDFIFKDTQVLPKSCVILENIVNSIQNTTYLN